MQNYYCPLCGTVFEMARAPKNGVPVCSKPGCVKKKQRYIASGEWKTLLDEVNHGPTDKPVGPKVVASSKSASHVVALKEKVKARILAKKGGLHELLASIPDDMGPQTPEEAVEAVQAVRGEFRECEHGQIFIPAPNPDAFNDFEEKVFPVTDAKHWPPFTPHPVENHGTKNDLARQTILSKVKIPKQDPDSDAATLERLNSIQTKKPVVKKGGQES